MYLKALTGAACAALLLAAPARASTYSQELLDIYGDFVGDTLRYDFAGLAPSDGTGGSLRIRTGVSLTSAFDGLDLNDVREYFTLALDGTTVGNYACYGSASITAIPGNTGGNDCDFDFTLDIATLGLDLAALVADGSLLVTLAFSDQVGFAAEQDQVFVTLTYEEAMNVVPLPASLGLLAGGLGLLGVARRRRR